MKWYQVICVDRAPAPDGSHAHITHFGLADASGWFGRVSVEQALAQISLPWGDRYYTISPTTGQRAFVIAGGCERCGRRPYVRTTADGLYDNNLSALPTCRLF